MHNLFFLQHSNGDRLSAQDILTIRKVHDYAYNKVYGEEGKIGEDGEKLEADTCLEILCMDQVNKYPLIILCRTPLCDLGFPSNRFWTKV